MTATGTKAVATGTVALGLALPEDGPEAAELIVSTGPEIYAYLFGDLVAARRLVGECWAATEGIFSHVHATVARGEGRLVGVELGFSEALRMKHLPATRALIERTLAPEAQEAYRAGVELIGYLIPWVPLDAYYLQFLAMSPAFRGQGLGARLLNQAVARARSEGLSSVHLDTDATKPAVGFYRRMGLSLLVETRVPALEAAGIPPHDRMVKAVSAAPQVCR
jgi:ribosomal protein S18 acetylase RimI-like enzyme